MTREESPLVETRTIQVGNYRFTGKILGKGTFATVEEAIHTSLKMKVSMKTINLSKCNSYIIKNLKREATILNKLDHPHILRLFETLKYNNTYCLVTEIVRGVDLCVFLQHRRGKILDEQTTRKFTRQITSALSYLHAKSIVHRDLKLENIMLDTQKQNIKLVDFGLSNIWNFQDPLKTLCGSPEYSAPELFSRGTQYGPEVDMWALGVVMYALATGHLPFPCISTVLKDPNKRSVFIKTIYNGLSQAHLSKIVGYSSDFIDLLKGLMNPQWEERLVVEDVIKGPWLSNKSHWVMERFETLDAHEVSKVVRQVCGQLEISETTLKEELKIKPCGEVAGFYNIIAYQRSIMCKHETSSLVSRFSTRTLMSSSNNKYSCEQRFQKQSTNKKVWIIGATSKINEVIKGKNPYPGKNYPSNILSPLSPKVQKIRNSDKIISPNLNPGNGHHHNLSIPLIGPLKVRKTDYLASDYSKSISRESEKITSPNIKFKDKSFILQQPILPSKPKFKYPVNKLTMAKGQLQKVLS